MRRNSYWLAHLPGTAPIKVHLVTKYVEQAYAGDPLKQAHICTAVQGTLSHLCRRLQSEHPELPAPFMVPWRVEWESLRDRLHLLQLGTPKAAALAEHCLLAWLLAEGAQSHEGLVKRTTRYTRRRAGPDDVRAALEKLVRSGWITLKGVGADPIYDLSPSQAHLLQEVPRWLPANGEWSSPAGNVRVHGVSHDPRYTEVCVVLEKAERPGLQLLPMPLWLMPVRRHGKWTTPYSLLVPAAV